MCRTFEDSPLGGILPRDNDVNFAMLSPPDVSQHLISTVDSPLPLPAPSCARRLDFSGPKDLESDSLASNNVSASPPPDLASSNKPACNAPGVYRRV